MSTAKSKKFNLEMKRLKAAIKAEYRQAFDKGIYYGTGKTLTLMCYIIFCITVSDSVRKG